ncbi:MAG TPA: helix-turn-helix transcriptional regulator [Polyangiaceae bacterium]|nr:helix-turn-helix transcriptional regulator [Polyangiaceae bacterium]
MFAQSSSGGRSPARKTRADTTRFFAGAEDTTDSLPRIRHPDHNWTSRNSAGFRPCQSGLGHAELGDAIGVTRHTIIAIEQGRYSPSLENAFRIARLLGLGVEDVFGWDE